MKRKCTPLLPLLFYGILLTFFGSCEEQHELVEMSADLANQHNSGSSSSYSSNGLFGLNLALGMMGVPVKSYRSVNSFDRSTTSGNVYIMGELEYIGKGTKPEVPGSSVKARLGYLEVPGYVLYHAGLGGNGGFYAGAGPYLAYGIGGKIKSTTNGQTVSQSAFEKNSFKRFDAGLTATAMYETESSLSMRLAYDLGLANVADAVGNDKTKNRCISLNVGYSLSKIITQLQGK